MCWDRVIAVEHEPTQRAKPRRTLDELNAAVLPLFSRTPPTERVEDVGVGDLIASR